MSPVQQAPAWIVAMLDAVDARDAAAFVRNLAPDGVFRFGNADAVQGRAAIEAAVLGFLSTFRGSRHQLLRFWADGDALAMQGLVTYTRLDGRELTLPFVNVFVMRGPLIAEYLIHIDIAPLYAA